MSRKGKRFLTSMGKFQEPVTEGQVLTELIKPMCLHTISCTAIKGRSLASVMSRVAESSVPL